MFIFYLLGVRLPCCSIFYQFWLWVEVQCVYLRRHLGSPIYFSCLITVAKTSSTIFNRSGIESGQPCLVPDLSGKDFIFCPLDMMLAVGLSCMVFIMLRNAPSIPTLLSVFIINGCCTLSNAFSASIYMIM